MLSRCNAHLQVLPAALLEQLRDCREIARAELQYAAAYSATAAATRRAYLRVIKRIHPDKLNAGAGSVEVVAAEQIFAALREASERGS